MGVVEGNPVEMTRMRELKAARLAADVHERRSGEQESAIMAIKTAEPKTTTRASSGKVSKRRIGKVLVSPALIDRDPQSHIAAFVGAIVVDVQRPFWATEWEYMTIHPEFEEVEIGAPAPMYRAVIEHDGDGPRRVGWEKIGDGSGG